MVAFEFCSCRLPNQNDFIPILEENEMERLMKRRDSHETKGYVDEDKENETMTCSTSHDHSRVAPAQDTILLHMREGIIRSKSERPTRTYRQKADEWRARRKRQVRFLFACDVIPATVLLSLFSSSSYKLVSLLLSKLFSLFFVCSFHFLGKYHSIVFSFRYRPVHMWCCVYGTDNWLKGNLLWNLSEVHVDLSIHDRWEITHTFVLYDNAYELVSPPVRSVCRHQSTPLYPVAPVIRVCFQYQWANHPLYAYIPDAAFMGVFAIQMFSLSFCRLHLSICKE